MDGHYYLMDDFISLYISRYLGWLFLHILLAHFCAGDIQMACGHALL